MFRCVGKRHLGHAQGNDSLIIDSCYITAPFLHRWTLAADDGEQDKGGWLVKKMVMVHGRPAFPLEELSSRTHHKQP